jgi:NTE family protein
MSDAEADGRTADGPTRVAIACQGGGSHTAFTAGFLKEVLREWDEDERELVGISGTSGGAFNALAAWYGLVTADAETAIDLLDDLWADLTVDGWDDWLTNEWLTGLMEWESSGFPVPMVSPYQVFGQRPGERRLAKILERHIDFDAVPDLCGTDAPELVVGTVNVNAGEFETFTNEDVSVDAVLASAAVPSLFEAVKINGHYHWDGLFSQNPPVDDLLTVPAERKPDELWVIQINPQTFEGEPRTLDVIADRRNELSGNISLNQDLRFVERVNRWVREGKLPADQFAETEVHRIEMGRRYGVSTKVDRSADFVAELMDLGRERAREFLESR